MSDQPQLVRYEVSGVTAVLTLDSPHNRNALSTRLIEQLHAGLARAVEDADVRLVVLTHSGNTFCAGADLSEATTASGDDPARARAEQLLGLLRAIVALELPVLAAVDGHVRAGGMGLLCACDLAVAGPASTFALTESRLGLAASVVSSVVLPRVSDREAARLLLTGRTVDAVEAAEIGLVSQAVLEIDAAVAATVQEFTAVSPQGSRESKELLNHRLLSTLDADAERLIAQSARLFASEEAREGMQAFLEKRQPRWAVAPQDADGA